MTLTLVPSVVEAAQALGPLISEHADETERERRLSREVVDALAEAGLLSLCAPTSLGGVEADPVTIARVVEILTGFDSAAGWAMMAANDVAWWVARLPDAGAEEIYAEGPSFFMATAFHPPMKAIEVAGGYRVSGQSPLASNCHEARWMLFTALVMDGDQPKQIDEAPQVIGAYFRGSECRIVDTWHGLGMRGSDSNDVMVDDVFVPTRRTFMVVPEFRPGRHYGGPLYRAPVMLANLTPWAPVALSMARGAIDEVRRLAKRKTPFASTTPLRERASAQAKLGLAEAMLSSARTYLYERVQARWEQVLAEKPLSIEQKAELLLAATHAMQTSAKVVELMYRVAGTSAIYSRSPLERHFRDIQVLKQHGFYSESRYETVGQVLFGLAPDLPFVAF
jgi:alkylation response protein AidB-like acyl-CoA dehydrogenase